MASVLRQTANATSEIASKAVHIKIWPRPTDLQESREILRVLQRFGEVTMFKTKRYDHLKPAPHTILAMFFSPDSASRLIRESPIKFTLEPEGVSNHQFAPEATFKQAQDPPNITAEDTSVQQQSLHDTPTSQSHDDESTSSSSSSSSTTSPSSPPPRDPAQTPPPTSSFPFTPWSRPARAPKRFHLTAGPSQMNHSTAISRQERHAGFDVFTGTVGFNDLGRRVPHHGMNDVHVKRREATADEIRAHMAEVKARPTLRGLYELGLREEAREETGGERRERDVLEEYTWGPPTG